MSQYIEIKQEFTTRFVKIIMPFIHQGISSIYDEAVQVTKDKKMSEVIKSFRVFLKEIPKWNKALVADESNKISSENEIGNLIHKLLEAVIKSHIQVLTRYNDLTAKLPIKMPKDYSFETFIHSCYVECAKEFFDNSLLFIITNDDEKNITNLQLAQNTIKEAIINAIRKMLPYEDIVQVYLLNDDELIAEQERVDLNQLIPNNKPRLIVSNITNSASSQFDKVKKLLAKEASNSSTESYDSSTDSRNSDSKYSDITQSNTSKRSASSSHRSSTHPAQLKEDSVVQNTRRQTSEKPHKSSEKPPSYDNFDSAVNSIIAHSSSHYGNEIKGVDTGVKKDVERKEISPVIEKKEIIQQPTTNNEFVQQPTTNNGFVQKVTIPSNDTFRKKHGGDSEKRRHRRREMESSRLLETRESSKPVAQKQDPTDSASYYQSDQIIDRFNNVSNDNRYVTSKPSTVNAELMSINKIKPDMSRYKQI
jgi:hypothetical protein